jgi:hypothetical protein
MLHFYSRPLFGGDRFTDSDDLLPPVCGFPTVGAGESPDRAIDAALRDGGQVILLLNRRGHSTHIQCPACGHSLLLANSILLTQSIDQGFELLQAAHLGARHILRLARRLS